MQTINTAIHYMHIQFFFSGFFASKCQIKTLILQRSMKKALLLFTKSNT